MDTFLLPLIKPKTKNKDNARREYILNILLLGLTALSLFGFLTAVAEKFILESGDQMYIGLAVEELFGFLLLTLYGYYLSRNGHARSVAYVLVGFIFLATIQAIFRWGLLPPALLMCALNIVMAGILIHSQLSFFVTGLVVLAITSLSALESVGLILFDTSWVDTRPSFGDVFVLSVMFLMIAVVSWLFNREGERALRRATRSEWELKRERDMLQVTVERRTRDLKIAQAEKLAQLYHFAEYGKLASGFIHDLANSASVISLSLDELEKNNRDGVAGEMKDLIRTSRRGAQNLKEFIQAARKQINNQSIRTRFSLNEEIRQVMKILEFKARKARVQLIFRSQRSFHTIGNPIRFYQLVENLVSNAIDAYHGTRRKRREVLVTLRQHRSAFELEVHDWGVGIDDRHVPHIFDPLFTTKGHKKGTGMGLSITNHIVTKDFGGTISVESVRLKGTVFLVRFPKYKKN